MDQICVSAIKKSLSQLPPQNEKGNLSLLFLFDFEKIDGGNSLIFLATWRQYNIDVFNYIHLL